MQTQPGCRRLSTGSWSKQRLSQSECLDANQDQTRVFGPQSEKGNGHFHGETKLNAPLLFPFKCEPEPIFKSLQQKCKASRANAVQPRCPCHALPALQTLRSQLLGNHVLQATAAADLGLQVVHQGLAGETGAEREQR